MRSYDLTDFLTTSALLNYQLSAKQLNWSSIMTVVLEGKQIADHDQEILLNVFDYLSKVYGKMKRALGPLSVLHPLRATALLSHASKEVALLDVITCLLHDTFEDFKPSQFKDSDWIKLDNTFQAFLSELPEDHQKRLKQQLQWLTKEPSETYYHYIGRLLDQAGETSEVVRVKLADRLDNTFDMRIELQDPLLGVDFFEIIFQMAFTNTCRGYRPDRPHQPTVIMNGADRLYQLFKNIVLMSLIRQKKAGAGDPVTQELFEALAKASMKEAQRIALHVFGYHEPDVAKFRKLLMETMVYSQSGGFDTVTLPNEASRLNGLLMTVFDQPKREARKKQLVALYRDKAFMIQVAISFVIIFLNFLNDPDYFIHGISADGVRPES
ncbi:MAG: hypothetical protein A4E74_00779 [Syntrophus sp. PtaB.Bin075]|nr:MAG: hypothetical protein A4E74_00779 [Syntrophus sp. PtaB.Bin075]